MSWNKKIFSIVIALFLTHQMSYAIVENLKFKSADKITKKEKKVKQDSKTAKTSKKISADDDLEPENIYTNDIHSKFSLDDSIKVAIEYNPALRSSIYNADMYKTKIVQAWANYFPSLSVGIQGGRSGGSQSNADYSYSNTVGYLPKASGKMLLFDFGKTKAQADAAKKTYEAKEFEKNATINDIIYQIKSSYFNLLYAQAEVMVYKDTVKDYELQLKCAEGFYKAGKKAKIDVITAQYNLGKAQLSLVNAMNNLRVTKVQLSKAMGIPDYSNYELTSQLSTLQYDLQEDGIIKTAFDVRPELLASHKTTEAAKMNLRAKRRAYAPDLGAFASYNNGLGSEFNLYDYQFGVGLSYSEFNILRTKKLVDEAKFAYKKSSADHKKLEDEVYLNVKKAYLTLNTNKEAIEIAKLALDEAQEQYRQVTGRYKAGVGDAIEVKDGETTYLNARLDFYKALLNYNIAAASLEKEVGIPLLPTDKNILKTKIN